MIRLFIALLLTAVLLVVSFRKPRIGIPATLAYLLLMGGLRRWSIPLLGYQATDPLVLISALVAGMLFLWSAVQPGPPASTLSKMVAWLLGLMLLQALNPLQGGVMVAASAIFFYIPPMLWFFIGRRLGEPALLRNLLRVYMVLACFAGIYTIYQTLYGFSVGEKEWIAASNFVALNVGRIRPFSFLTSPAELAGLLSSSIAVLAAAAICGRRRGLLLIPLLAVALFFVSGRGAVVSGLASCCLVWALASRHAGTWFIRAVVALSVVTAIAALGFGRLAENLPDDERIRPLVQHQVEGLTDPFGERSTGSGHVTMVLAGLWIGIKHPLGHGLGATAGGSNFGGGDLSTEGDVSNLFVSLGMFGGLLYVGIVVLCFRRVIRLWRSTRSPLVLMVFGVLVQQTLNWLNGGQYATAMFIWVSLGALDGIHERRSAAAMALAQQRRREASGSVPLVPCT